jgi:hypothetical protein
MPEAGEVAVSRPTVSSPATINTTLYLVLDFAAEFNMGQFNRLRRSQARWRQFQLLDPQLDVLHIKILEALFDLAGAKGHNDSRSALTMTQDVWESYHVARDTLEAVNDSALSHRKGYDRFLDTRSKRLERKGFRCLKMDDLEERSLLRLLTIGRVTELKIAQLFESAFGNLNEG